MATPNPVPTSVPSPLPWSGVSFSGDGFARLSAWDHVAAHVGDLANLALSGAALAVALAALRIARRQLTLDERSLHLAERESAVADRERAARSDLRVGVVWNPEGGVAHSTSINAPFNVRVTVRNDGDRDATDVVVALLVAVELDAPRLDLGRASSGRETRVIEGRSWTFQRFERTLKRVRSVEQEVVGGAQFIRGIRPHTDVIAAPVVVEVRCDDQPDSKKVQVFTQMLSWYPPEHAPPG